VTIPNTHSHSVPNILLLLTHGLIQLLIFILNPICITDWLFDALLLIISLDTYNMY